MKLLFLLSIVAAALAIGCGRNEPGTMGGEPGVPETVGTGAPAQFAQGTSVTDPGQSAIASEHASSTYDDSANTNVELRHLPDASTREPESAGE